MQYNALMYKYYVKSTGMLFTRAKSEWIKFWKTRRHETGKKKKMLNQEEKQYKALMDKYYDKPTMLFI